jgi:hypothetical protein
MVMSNDYEHRRSLWLLMGYEYGDLIENIAKISGKVKRSFDVSESKG